MVQNYRERSDFKTDDPVYIEFAKAIEKEAGGNPNSCIEDVIFYLCGNDHSPEHESNIKKIKMSQVEIKLIIKEKESFVLWLNRSSEDETNSKRS